MHDQMAMTTLSMPSLQLTRKKCAYGSLLFLRQHYCSYKSVDLHKSTSSSCVVAHGRSPRASWHERTIINQRLLYRRQGVSTDQPLHQVQSLCSTISQWPERIRLCHHRTFTPYIRRSLHHIDDNFSTWALYYDCYLYLHNVGILQLSIKQTPECAMRPERIDS